MLVQDMDELKNVLVPTMDELMPIRMKLLPVQEMDELKSIALVQSNNPTHGQVKGWALSL